MIGIKKSIKRSHWITFGIMLEGGSESSVIVVITLLIDMIGCCIIP